MQWAARTLSTFALAHGKKTVCPPKQSQIGSGREENCSAGGGVTRGPIFSTPRLGRRDGRGGSGRVCPTCCAGGGVDPTSMAQNDTHVALIILTTQMWGGEITGGNNFFGPKFVFLRLRRQHPLLHKTKGPTRNPISPTHPPSFGGRPCHPPPPPRRAIFRPPSLTKQINRHPQGQPQPLDTMTTRTHKHCPPPKKKRDKQTAAPEGSPVAGTCNACTNALQGAPKDARSRRWRRGQIRSQRWRQSWSNAGWVGVWLMSPDPAPLTQAQFKAVDQLTGGSAK